MMKKILILAVLVLAVAWAMQPLRGQHRGFHQHHKRQLNNQQHRLHQHQDHQSVHRLSKSEHIEHAKRATPLIAKGHLKHHGQEKLKSQRNTRQTKSNHSGKESKVNQRPKKQHHAKKRHTGVPRRH